MRKMHLAAVIFALVLIAGCSGRTMSIQEERQVIAAADTTAEAAMIHKLADVQNRYIECMEEVLQEYEAIGMPPMSTDEIAEAKMCTVSVTAEAKANDATGGYIVEYRQSMPVQCESSKAKALLLRVFVDKEKTNARAEWPNDATPNVEAALQSMDGLLEKATCSEYAKAQLGVAGFS